MKHFNKSTAPWLLRKRAFSLVEVTIALAIAGLGFVTLLGLLPHGMEVIRKTSELSVGSKIIQKLSGELQSMSWADITWQGYGPPRYFNDEGVEIARQDLQGSVSTNGLLAYVASVYVPNQAAEVLLPTGNASSTDTYMRRVRICVAASSDPAFDFNKATPQHVTTCSVMLAKMHE